MPETIEKIEYKTTETIEPKQIKQKPDNHAIDAYIVGLPGQERLVAHTKTDEQITVRELQSSELTRIIEEYEERELERKTIDERLENAGEIVSLSKTRNERLIELDRFLDNLRDHLMIADFETILDERIPPADKHFLIAPSKAEEVKNKFQELDGYSLTIVEHSDGELALVIEGDITLVFVYAKEKEIKEEEQKTETITIQELEEQMIGEILELAKKEDTEKTDDEIAEEIIKIFEKYEEEFKNQNEGKRFEKIINSLDPEQNIPLAQSLNETAQTRLIMAITQFRMDQEDKGDERGFIGVGMGDVYR